MLSRRTVFAMVLLGRLAWAIPARAGWEAVAEWFLGVTTLAGASLEDIYRYLLRARQYRLLFDGRARLEDVRRKLTDSTAERSLHSKLHVWLGHYDAFVALAPRTGEGPEDFNFRRERERAALEKEWQRCRNDAIAALKEIEALGVELQSIDPAAMPSREWQAYRMLLADEKELAEFLNSDMPVEPPVLARMREAASRLDGLVLTIDRHRDELDQAIRKAG